MYVVLPSKVWKDFFKKQFIMRGQKLFCAKINMGRLF